MKIALSAMGPGLDSEIDPRFGRSEYFVVVDMDTMQSRIVRNPNLNASSGAGISTAQLICSQGVETVITGRIGPKAHQVFSAAGVRMLTGISGRIDEAIEMFKSGRLRVETDSGAVQPMRSEAGVGGGMGGGRGMGIGRGMGRGMECGGGRGMGGGRSGAVGGQSLRNRDAEPRSRPPVEAERQEDIASLKRRAEELAEELEEIKQRIDRIEKR